ncbi:DUF554 domain-containing protein [Cohnella pontilimi]|uniref:DUF554 domain-containing protein n=1 Tax=Cohnella pontilimi TaxID=2564100 RepID=A0A4U0FA89_9BACL|nr:DUF554 family protein [Cohnella pontilimi]TJY41551.1 DUF554 domain-containing protein [Cohnella pontilimi]
MALWGTIVNAVAIIAGSILGRIFPSIPDRIHKTVMQGLGMAIVILGITMAIKTENFLILIISLVLGGVSGELLKVEYRLQQFGGWLEQRVGGAGKESGTRNIAEGFVTATLVYCVGAMAILGSLESGANLGGLFSF